MFGMVEAPCLERRITKSVVKSSYFSASQPSLIDSIKTVLFPDKIDSNYTRSFEIDNFNSIKIIFLNFITFRNQIFSKNSTTSQHSFVIQVHLQHSWIPDKINETQFCQPFLHINHLSLGHFKNSENIVQNNQKLKEIAEFPTNNQITKLQKTSLQNCGC